ncbi:hypothetical protein [Deinococcus sp. YIM 77859]|uniref:hypothetical protein n=1 Tax=Deinococcus sp. YIM 77859 TaxID=1540221 RepID=UPI0005510FCC|nr:hypothetical protein [Deinococcus sp. YIM 77859]
MRKTSITSQSNPNVVALTANVAGTATPVFKLTVPRGAVYRLHNANMVRGQVVNGTYIILDLRDAAGNKISGASKVLVATRGPADEFPRFHRALPYSIWRDLDTTQQRNEDFKATIIGQADLNVGPGIEIQEAHELLLYVDGPQVVDWSKSFVQIDFEELN